MSSRQSLRRSLNKTRYFSDDSMGSQGSRAERRKTDNSYEECPECSKRLKAKNLVSHLEVYHADITPDAKTPEEKGIYHAAEEGEV